MTRDATGHLEEVDVDFANANDLETSCHADLDLLARSEQGTSGSTDDCGAPLMAARRGRNDLR
jgi:hypothetical protein